MGLSVADLRKHVTSTLGDPALQKLLDAAYEAMVARAGPEGAATDTLSSGNGPLLLLNRQASAITSVTEDGTLLDATDYLLRSSGSVLERLRTGPSPRWYWRGRVDVVYTPLVDTANRDRVAIALVKLDLAHTPGVIEEQIGDYQVAYGPKTAGATNYDAERESLLETLLFDRVAIF